MSLSNVVLEICIHNNIYILAIIASIPLKKRKEISPVHVRIPRQGKKAHLGLRTED
jgi:hypothetical protein